MIFKTVGYGGGVSNINYQNDRRQIMWISNSIKPCIYFNLIWFDLT